MVETEGQTLLIALEEAKNQLGTEKIIYTKEEIKGKLFKAGKFKVKAISYQNLLKQIEDYLQSVINNLGLKVNFESNIRDEIINITMYSDNNSILIGKDGQTLKALEIISKSYIKKEWGITPKIILDVENYKEKREKNLEKLALKVAKEVRATKVDAELDNMNSYERRIIHNKLSNFKGVTTQSVGEEPNRHIIIKAVD